MTCWSSSYSTRYRAGVGSVIDCLTAFPDRPARIKDDIRKRAVATPRQVV